MSFSDIDVERIRFGLFANPMRGRAEDSFLVAAAPTREALIDFIRAEEVELYIDDRWHKCYRKGGPLEWYNKCETVEGAFGHGIFPVRGLDEVLRAARDRYMFEIAGAVILK